MNLMLNISKSSIFLDARGTHSPCRGKMKLCRGEFDIYFQFFTLKTNFLQIVLGLEIHYWGVGTLRWGNHGVTTPFWDYYT